MSSQARLSLGVVVKDGNGAVSVSRAAPPVQWTTGALLPKREVISLTGSAFTALSPPSCAKFMVLSLGSAPSLTLKSITGDQGIPLTPSSSVTDLPLCLPINSPSIGILNGAVAAASIDILWL